MDLNNPTPATYRVTIDYFDGATDTLDVKLNSFQLTSANAGNLTVTPASQSVTTGQSVTFNASWSGLDASQRYLGAVTYNDGTTAIGRTLVNVLP